jgi:hypothetical protein
VRRAPRAGALAVLVTAALLLDAGAVRADAQRVTLDALIFYEGVEDGQPLIMMPRRDARPPRFRTAMTPAELTEFVAASLFGTRFPPTDVRPAPFGSAPGFRFDVAYEANEGARYSAIVALAVLGGRLYVIAYTGTSLYHFDKYRDEAERILASIRVKG